MCHGAVDAREVKNKGWRQGSVLPDAFVQSLRENGSLAPSIGEQKFIVASHDCDVTNPSFEAEPDVELLPAAVLDASEKDGNYFWGKSSRFYQLERNSSGGQCIWQFSIQDRILFPRRYLLASQPDTESALTNDEKRGLALWLARRYHRAAFPDAFVDRTRRAAGKLRKPLKDQGHHLTAILLFTEDDELPSELPYEIIIYGSMLAEDWSEPRARAAAQELLGSIEASFGECDGIEVKELVLCSEADISLDDLRRLKRWDCDNLTIRGEQPNRLVPEQ